LKENYNKAIEYYNLSLDIYYKYGENEKSAEIKFEIGTIVLDFERDKSRSIKYFEESLDIYEDVQYIKEAAEVLLKLGDIYISMDLHELALKNLEKAKYYYVELQDENSSRIIEEKMKSLNNVKD
jgi:tetratricopeptide (TPR) repeat protein